MDASSTDGVDTRRRRVLMAFEPQDAGEFASKLSADLIERGYEVMLGEREVESGNPNNSLPADVQNNTDLVLALLTPGCVGQQNGPCLNAISMARSEDLPIIPVMVEQCRPPLGINRLNWLDLQNWRQPEEYERGLEHLLADIDATPVRDAIPFAHPTDSASAETMSNGPSAPSAGRRVMISYGHKDATELAQKLRAYLTTHGFDVWLDEYQIRLGHDWEDRIERAIDNADVVLALLTPHAVRRPDGICLDEISLARSQGRRIVPAMVVVCRPPLTIFRLDWMDFQGWEQPDVYERLLDRLVVELKRQTVETDGVHAHLFDELGPIDFGPELARLSIGFTGRKWLATELAGWFDERRGRIFFLTGDPGSGKSVFLASIISRHPAVGAYHFCVKSLRDSIEPRRFVCSIAAQLATQFPQCNDALQRMDLPSVLASDPGTLFRRLVVEPLHTVSPEGQVLLVLDALDESLGYEGTTIAHVLRERLEDLPPWVRVLASSRPEPALLEMFGRYSAYSIDASRSENRDDIREFITGELAEANVAHRLSTAGVSAGALADRMADQAAGNFLYAAQVLSAVAGGSLDPTQPDSFPRGLADFYSFYFDRTFPTPAQYDAVRPLLEVLCASREPLSAGQLAAFSGRTQFAAERDVEPLAAYFPRRQGHYRVFHQSLVDWLCVQASARYRIDLISGHHAVASRLWADFERGAHEPYLLHHLAPHLTGAGDIDKLGVLLSTPAFLEAKVASGLTFELATDFAAHQDLAASPTEPAAQNMIALAFGTALRRTQHFIARHPSTLFQCLWNLCSWQDADGPVAVALRAWRASRDETSTWVRELRSPALSLDSPLQAVLTGHEGAVLCVASSPQGRLIASSGMDGTVRLWDRISGESVNRLRRHRGPVSSVDFSPNGDLLASASHDGSVIVWNVERETELMQWSVPGCKVLTISFSPDGRVVAAGDSLGLIHTIDVWSGKVVQTMGDVARAKKLRQVPGGPKRMPGEAVQLPRATIFYKGFDPPPVQDRSTRYVSAVFDDEHFNQVKLGTEACVTALSFAPEGKLLASGSWDQRIHVWDPDTAEESLTLAGHENWVKAVAFSPDGACLASGADDWTVRIWHVADIREGLTTRPARPIRWLSASRHIAEIRPRLILSDHLGPVTGVDFSHDGRLLATSSTDGVVRVREVTSGESIAVLAGHPGAVMSVAMGGDGDVITGCSDGAIRRWSIGSMRRSSKREGHTGNINEIAFATDGKLCFTGSDDGTSGVWNTENGSLVTMLRGSGGRVTSLSTAPNGLLACCFDIGTVDIWQDLNRIMTLSAAGATSARLLLGGGRLLTIGRESISVWDRARGIELTSILAGAGKFDKIAISKDERTLAVARWMPSAPKQFVNGEWLTFDARDPSEAGALVFVLDLEQGKHKLRWRLGESESESCSALALSPDGGRLAIASTAGRLCMIDTSSGAIRLDDQDDPIDELGFSRDGLDLVAHAGDRTFSYETRADLRSPESHAAPVAPNWTAEVRSDGVAMRSHDSGQEVAWLDGTASHLVKHPSRPIWAASAGPNLRLFVLEGVATESPANQTIDTDGDMASTTPGPSANHNRIVDNSNAGHNASLVIALVQEGHFREAAELIANDDYLRTRLQPQTNQDDAFRMERHALRRDIAVLANSWPDGEDSRPFCCAIDALVSLGFSIFGSGSHWDKGKRMLTTAVMAAGDGALARSAFIPCYIAVCDRLRPLLDSHALYEGRDGDESANTLENAISETFDEIRAKAGTGFSDWFLQWEAYWRQRV